MYLEAEEMELVRKYNRAVGEILWYTDIRNQITPAFFEELWGMHKKIILLCAAGSVEAEMIKESEKRNDPRT